MWANLKSKNPVLRYIKTSRTGTLSYSPITREKMPLKQHAYQIITPDRMGVP